MKTKKLLIGLITALVFSTAILSKNGIGYERKYATLFLHGNSGFMLNNVLNESFNSAVETGRLTGNLVSGKQNSNLYYGGGASLRITPTKFLKKLSFLSLYYSFNFNLVESGLLQIDQAGDAAQRFSYNYNNHSTMSHHMGFLFNVFKKKKIGVSLGLAFILATDKMTFSSTGTNNVASLELSGTGLGAETFTMIEYTWFKYINVFASFHLQALFVSKYNSNLSQTLARQPSVVTDSNLNLFQIGDTASSGDVNFDQNGFNIKIGVGFHYL